MQKETDFTKGKILLPLLRFMVPVFFAMFLQSLYGAVDLLIVGKFASSADVSAVSTGSQMMMTLTGLVGGFAMGITIQLGQLIGEGNRQESGRVMGTGICLFVCIAAVLTVLLTVFAEALSVYMHAPQEAFAQTTAYLRICGIGTVFIVGYNLIGSIFRGLGDSRTPLFTVIIACICNILGDLLLVAVFHMGTAGAAIATVFAQAVSVAASLLMIRRQPLPFTFTKKELRLEKRAALDITRIGLPIALQDLLVSISFLIILAIVNSLGLIASAGVGVAEKVCGFIMLVPSAFMQAMAAFVAQNVGAGRYDRANKTLLYASLLSATFAVVMFAVTFFRGDLLAAIFAKDAAVIDAAAEYLKAYAIDCLLTCFLFCFIGYFNGFGMTRFVMLQGVIGAFAVRVPVSFLMSRQNPVSLFHIGLATPCSSVVQILLCVLCLLATVRKYKNPQNRRLGS